MLNSQLADFSMLPGFGLREIRLTPDPIASLRSPFPLVGCSSLGPEDNWGLGLCYRFVVFGGLTLRRFVLEHLTLYQARLELSLQDGPPALLFSLCFHVEPWGVLGKGFTPPRLRGLGPWSV